MEWGRCPHLPQSITSCKALNKQAGELEACLATGRCSQGSCSHLVPMFFQLTIRLHTPPFLPAGRTDPSTPAASSSSHSPRSLIWLFCSLVGFLRHRVKVYKGSAHSKPCPSQFFSLFFLPSQENTQGARLCIRGHSNLPQHPRQAMPLITQATSSHCCLHRDGVTSPSLEHKHAVIPQPWGSFFAHH